MVRVVKGFDEVAFKYEKNGITYYSFPERNKKGYLVNKAYAESLIDWDIEPRAINNAFGDLIKRYVINAIPPLKYNYEMFGNNCHRIFTNLLENVILTRRNFKMRLTFQCNMYKYVNVRNPDDTITIKKEPKLANFSGPIEIIYNANDIDNVLNNSFYIIESDLQEFISNGSGWNFDECHDYTIGIVKFNPLRGNQYIPTPTVYNNSKYGLINIKNNDSYCFAYCMAYHDMIKEGQAIRNPDRVSHYKEKAKIYIDSGVEFPMKLNDIHKIEAKFNKKINVYGYADKSIYPLRLTKLGINDVDECINLLLLSNCPKNEDDNKKHYIYVKSLSALLRENTKDHHTHVCPSCLHFYRHKEDLNNHLNNGCGAFVEKTKLPTEEKATDYVQFKNYQKMLKNPFIIYADFESILKNNVETIETKATLKYQKHNACSYAYKIVSSVPEYTKDIVIYRAKDDNEDVGEKFVNELLKESEDLVKIMKNIIPMNLTEEQTIQHNHASHCYLCNCEFGKEPRKLFKDDEKDLKEMLENELNEMNEKELKKLVAKDLQKQKMINKENYNYKKVRDHDHLTGEYRGAAHSICNLKYSWRHIKIPVVFHNLKGYDSHLIIKSFKNKDLRINCIPTSTEKFLSFSLANLNFIDSCNFMMSSLEKLTNSLLGFEDDKKPNETTLLKNINDNFTHFNEHFKSLNNKQKILLTQKGVYPYDYMNSFDKFNETTMPTKDKFYSELEQSEIDDNDYEQALNVRNEMNLKNLGDYHDLYLITDVLLLADIFEAFRNMCIDYYKLDPSHYLTLPGLAWDALLKMTNIKLDVISDYDIYLMIERGIRGGISSIMNRYSKANNKYMPDYNTNEIDKFIMYFDANNLYGHAMIQKLPTKNYKFEQDMNKFTVDFINSISNDSKIGYILDVDLEYPKELHDLHNDYPLAPESIEINDSMISPKLKEMYEITERKFTKGNKLVPNLRDKKNYVVHYRNLKLYLQLGLKLVKVNRVVSFDQSNWMKEYIDFNTNKRKDAKNEFEKDLFKLFNNAVFGKTMENVRNRIRYELVNDEKRAMKIHNDVTFKDFNIINENLTGYSRSKTCVVLDKPIAIGFCILDLSKELMYDFHYNTMKKQYNDKVKLLFTDTDSLCYEINTNDVYDDMKTNKNLYDLSNYSKNHKLFDNTNKKVIGKMKDEAGGEIITEFIGLRSKMYSYLIQDDSKEHKKAKGIKRSALKKEIRHYNYYNCLFSNEKYDIMQNVNFNTIRSYNHEIFTINNSKIGLCSMDDKRYLLNNNINTLAYGHKSI